MTDIELCAQQFNTLHGVPTGVVFALDTKGFMRSKRFPSLSCPRKYYHFEFWKYNEEDLYACIHTTHNHLPNINLIETIKSKSSRIKKRIEGRLGEIQMEMCLRGWSGGGPPNETHTLNIKCWKGNIPLNVRLMFELYQCTIDFPI